MILFSSVNCKLTRRFFILVVGTFIVGYYLMQHQEINKTKPIWSIIEQNRHCFQRIVFNISANVHILDLTATTNIKFQCIKTKTLLNNLTTHICLHQRKKDMYISGAFENSTSVWEEVQVTRILQLLIRHPHLHFIDIGANIGTYTMFVAALGRFVLAIDCFAPNLVRLRRAVQLANVSHRVVLVQNALYTHSGQSLPLSVDTKNIGGQAIYPFHNYSGKHHTGKNVSTQNPYIVKTITFDDVLPILAVHGIGAALLKIDIEGSESFVVESGSRVFDAVDIPFVQMEWKIVRQYDARARIILKFFSERDYNPMTSSCHLLNLREHKLWPEEIYWLKGNASDFC